MKTKIALVTLILTAASYASEPAWDIGHFKNDLGRDVIVYLTHRPGRYYAVFGIDSAGTNSIDLHSPTIAIITLVPRGKEGHLILVPEGKRIASSKLFIPPRTAGDRGDRNLFYLVSDGQIRFVRPQEAKKWPISRRDGKR